MTPHQTKEGRGARFRAFLCRWQLTLANAGITPFVVKFVSLPGAWEAGGGFVLGIWTLFGVIVATLESCGLSR